MVHKTISYTAPESLSGNFSLMLFAKNSRGLTLAARSLGDVTLEKKLDGTLYIDPSSCYISFAKENKKLYLETLFTVNEKSSEIVAVCTAINSTNKKIVVAPYLVTRLRNIYGAQVLSTIGSSTETLEARESKEIKVTIPKAFKPQAYYVEMSLQETATNMQSNKVSFRYLVDGVGGSIRTATLDKDYYSKGDTAVLSLLWTPFDSSFLNTDDKIKVNDTALRDVVAKISLVTSSGIRCSSDNITTLTKNDRLLKIKLPIEVNCTNPEIKIEIVDKILGELDMLNLSIISNIPNNEPRNEPYTKSGSKNNIPLVLISLTALTGLALFLYYRKKMIKPIPASVIVMFLVFTILPIHSAKAIGVQLFYFCNTNCPVDTAIFMNADLDRATYVPGQVVNVEFDTTSDDHPQPPSPQLICLYGIARINSGLDSIDAYPSCYTQQQVRGGSLFRVVNAGVAPPTTGTFTMEGGSPGYGLQSATGVLTVVAGAPSVNINFSKFNELRTRLLSLYTNFIDELRVEKVFAGDE